MDQTGNTREPANSPDFNQGTIPPDATPGQQDPVPEADRGRATLRSRLLLLFAIAVLPSLLISFLINYSDYRIDKNHIDERMLAAANSVAIRHQQANADSQRLLKLMAQASELRSAGACERLLARSLAQFPAYANFAVVRPNGSIRCSAKPLAPRTYADSRDFLESVVSRRGFATGRYRVDPDSRAVVLDLGYPATRPGAGGVDAVLVATLRMDWFYESVGALRLPSGSTVVLLDRTGTILGHYPDPDNWIGRSATNTAFVRATLGPVSARLVEVDDLQGQRSQFVSRTLPGFADEGVLHVSIGTPASALYANATGAYLLDLAVLMLGGLLMLAAMTWGSRELVLKQVYALLGVVRRQKAGDAEARAPVAGVQEFAELAGQINAMFDARSRAEQTLRESEKARTDAQRVGKTGNWAWDVNGDQLIWAFGGAPLIGPLSIEDAMTRHIHEDDRQRFRDNVAAVVRDKSNFSAEYRWQMENGPERVILITGEVQEDAYGRATRLLGAVQDITGRKRSEEALRLSNRAIETSSNGILIADATKPDFPVVYVNPALLVTTGYTSEEMIGRNCRFLQGGDRDQPGIEQIRQALKEGRETEVVLRNYRKDGTLFWNQLKISPVMNELGVVTHFMGIQNDITAMKQYEAELERQANYDDLTGLPNRNLLTDRLTLAIAEAKRAGRLVGVLWLNIDRFQRINESIGRSAGDSVLKTVGERLSRSMRESDTVARMGGDQFGIVLPDIDSPEAAALVARKLNDAVLAPISIAGQEIFLTSNIGISLYPHDAQWVSTLLANAEIAMAKSRGKTGGYGYYAAAMNSAAAARLELESELRYAIDRQELLLHYQPRVDLATGRINGVEALVRWQHPKRGLVSPAEFIPLAEETGLIVPMGEWILETACAQSRAWSDAGYKGLRMAVNLSPRQFRKASLAQDVDRAMRKAGIDSSSLELEITESVAMDDPAQSRRILQELKSAGFSLAVDDFGTGHSSLGYLSNFPIDYLKIDQSFVRGTPTSSRNSVIVRTIIALAHNLSLELIAEGVETEEQRRFLQMEGCEEAQGYFFSRPQPAEKLVELFEARNLQAVAPVIAMRL